jgi:hypothetical protein
MLRLKPRQEKRKERHQCCQFSGANNRYLFYTLEILQVLHCIRTAEFSPRQGNEPQVKCGRLRRRIGRFVSKSKSPKRPREFCPKLIFYPTIFSSTYTQGVELFSPPSTSHTSPLQLPTTIFTSHYRPVSLPAYRASRCLPLIVLNYQRLSRCATLVN